LSATIGSSTRIVQGFVDKTVNELLGLKDEGEATIYLSPVGPQGHRSTDHQLKGIDSILPRVQHLSEEETKYAGIWEAHRASFLQSKEEIEKWAKVRLETSNSQRTTYPKIPLPPPMIEATKSTRLGEVILRRGSTRRFARSPITLSQLSTVLRASTGPIPRDYLPESGNLIETYFIANAVEGLAPGSYFYGKEQNSLEELKRGELRQMSAYLCLGQD